jgi:hypothetical protein
MKCCSIGLTHPHSLHPSACASDFWTCSTDPPFYPFCSKTFAQKGCWLRLSWEFQRCVISSVGVAQKKLETSPQKPKPHRGTTPPHPHIPDVTHLYTNQLFLTTGIQISIKQWEKKSVLKLCFLQPLVTGILVYWCQWRKSSTLLLPTLFQVAPYLWLDEHFTFSWYPRSHGGVNQPCFMFQQD